MDSENTSFQMPVMPAYGGNNGGFGFGGDGMWLLLFILLCGGGWGFGGGFGGGMWPMMMGGGFGMDYLYPWLNNSQHISDGFRDQNLATAISGLQSSVTSGFGDVALGIAGINQNLCQTGNGIVTAVNGAQNAISQQLYSNEIASLNRSFAEQTANTAGFTGVNAGLADLKYVEATEACATRTANANNTTAVLNALNNGIQAIKDQLCSDKIESKNDLIAQLRSELMFARGQASQDVQTAAIQAGQRALANEVEQYVLPTPRPAYVVANPNCCQPYGGCGCNGGFVN